ncbi:MAG: hypothetical protein IAE79_13640 [Anaerolinea sp.]|nr:hypothetical protein [Anaerolinea sp.]
MSKSYRPLSHDAGVAFGAAHFFGKEFGHQQITSKHLLLGILKTPDCDATLSLMKMGTNPYKLGDILRHEMNLTKVERFWEGPITKSPEIDEIENLADQEAQKQGKNLLSTRHLLHAMLQHPQQGVAKWLQFHGVTLVDLQKLPSQKDEQRPHTSGNWALVSEIAKTTLTKAQLIATQHEQTLITSSHILLAILDTPESNAYRQLANLIEHLEPLRANLSSHIHRLNKTRQSESQIKLADEVKKMLDFAVEEYQNTYEFEFIDTHSFLIGILRESNSHAAQVLGNAYITIDQVRAQPRYVREYPVKYSKINLAKQAIIKRVTNWLTFTRNEDTK